MIFEKGYMMNMQNQKDFCISKSEQTFEVYYKGKIAVKINPCSLSAMRANFYWALHKATEALNFEGQKKNCKPITQSCHNSTLRGLELNAM